MATAIVLAGIALTEVGADLRLAVDACNEQHIHSQY
jgi:hypothetical protein